MTKFDEQNSNEDSTAIEVFLRIRPPPSDSPVTNNCGHFHIDEIDESQITIHAKKSIINNNTNDISVDVVNNSRTKHTFKFNRILNFDSNQEEVFNCVGAPAVKNVLKGLNSTVFAYGQTGSGKVRKILITLFFKMAVNY
jgi:hypothetical protein